MTTGFVRDRLPRVSLAIATRSANIEVEFVVDTAFDGELSLPPEILLQLGITPSGRRSLMLADGTLTQSLYYRAVIEWNEESRPTEIILLDANPLLGVEVLAEMFLQIEMTERGEVRIDEL